MTSPEALAVVVDAGPVGAALLIALDNHRRLRALSERLHRIEKG